MALGVVLLLMGLAGVVIGLRVAFDVRGAAVQLERKMEANYALRAQAQGHLNPPDRWVSATGWRWFAGVIALLSLFVGFVGLVFIVAP
ncbi:hypothetical protein [Streptomyces sp. NPDC059991]|uniref:hypothetical protein n=1 Tax=unclassified Streptomyces TaxID=2593676 RepID=UPI0036C27AA5